MCYVPHVPFDLCSQGPDKHALSHPPPCTGTLIEPLNRHEYADKSKQWPPGIFAHVPVRRLQPRSNRGLTSLHLSLL